MTGSLRNSLARAAIRFYRSKLSRYLVFRLVREGLLGGYRKVFSVLSGMAGRRVINQYTQVPMSEYAKQVHGACESLLAAAEVNLVGPRFLGPHAADMPAASCEAMVSPEIKLCRIKEATVIGGTYYVLAGDRAIVPDAFHESRSTSPAEQVGVAVRDNAGDSLVFHLKPVARHADRAANLVGQSSRNFAHFLTEILPKLVILDSLKEFHDYPLLIDAGLHPNMKAAIVLLNRWRRDLIEIERWSAASVSTLLNLSLPGFEPYIPDSATGRGRDAYSNRFSPSALAMLRMALVRAVEHTVSGVGDKVFLARSLDSPNLRKLLNVRQVEELVSEKGFDRIEPGAMAIDEQIAAVRDARFIVGPVGASLANMIFAPPGCKVIVLSGHFPEGNYSYYSNLAEALGHDFYYLPGRVADSGIHDMHRDYEIDCRALSDAIDRLE